MMAEKEAEVSHSLERMFERYSDNGMFFRVKDYPYIFGDDLSTIVFIDKNKRYIGFGSAKNFLDESLAMANCIAEIVGSVGGTMILKLYENTVSDFKVGKHCDVYKKVGMQNDEA